ncbi:MAG: hypothetical protein IT292_01050 [Deltaproteobacteria bacterium]|nr:hypothetical protein [Deltaproteobacteria bacterium]
MKTFISPEEAFKLEQAIVFLVEHYTRTGRNPKPVIFHSLKVGMCLLDYGYETDIVITGILHDLLEDSDVTSEEIIKTFSKKVLTWIEAVSFKPEILDPVQQYREMFSRTKAAGLAPILVKAADLIANSFYIHLIADLTKQRQLVNKLAYFIDLVSDSCSDPIISELKTCYKTEDYRLTALGM